MRGGTWAKRTAGPVLATRGDGDEPGDRRRDRADGATDAGRGVIVQEPLQRSVQRETPGDQHDLVEPAGELDVHDAGDRRRDTAVVLHEAQR